MSSSQARGVASTLRVLQVLQARGLAWMATVKSREEVSVAMNGYMATLGIVPAELPPVIHIAGTKGKGSTAAMAEAVLRAGGLRTGLFTSPHLISPVERFRIDGVAVGDEEYCAQFWRAWTDLGGEGEVGNGGGIGYADNDSNCSPALLSSLPGFNFLTLLAFRIFAAARVDVMVLEVGVGGLLDATNVLPPSRVLASCITQLDYDHTDILGPTLSLIAAQKAGIAKEHVPLCVTRDAASEADAVICETARRAHTLAWTASHSADSLPANISLRGRFQRANAALAVTLVDAALARAVEDDVDWPSWSPGGKAAALAAARTAGVDGGALRAARAAHAYGDAGAPPPPLHLRAVDAPLPKFYSAGLANTVWPGRAQVVSLTGGVCLFVDGAHTALSMREVGVWFYGELNAAASLNADAVEAPAVKPARKRKPALIFYCGPDKDALFLILSLAVLLPWASVSIVKPEWSLTPRTTPPLGLAGALIVAGERARSAGDTIAAADCAAAAALAMLRLTTMPTTTSWPATLVELWRASICAPELSALRDRARAANALGGGATAAAAVAEAATLSELAVLQPLASLAVLQPSLIAAINDAKAKGCTDILVTGSLYLVGDTLRLAKEMC